MKRKGHLTDKDRELIYLYINKDCSMRNIGEKIGRDHTVVSREIERNRGPDGRYSPFEANNSAVKRRTEANKRNPLKNPRILRYVKDKLQEKWSPEQISGRIKIEIPSYSISHEAIYQYIYRKENKKDTLWVFLRRKRPRRMRKQERKVKKAFIPNRTFIGLRPEYINQRKEIGHWESDLMEGRRSSKGAVSVNTERKTRFITLSKVKDKGSYEKARVLIESMLRMPPVFRRSITFDNGSENAKHERVSEELNLNTYFCHPYHSWEKGTVENSIGFVREYIPKKTNMEEISQDTLNLVAVQLNDRPRKCLGFRTPYEIFYRELNGAF